MLNENVATATGVEPPWLCVWHVRGAAPPGEPARPRARRGRHPRPAPGFYQHPNDGSDPTHRKTTPCRQPRSPPWASSAATTSSRACTTGTSTSTRAQPTRLLGPRQLRRPPSSGRDPPDVIPVQTSQSCCQDYANQNLQAHKSARRRPGDLFALVRTFKIRASPKTSGRTIPVKQVCWVLRGRRQDTGCAVAQSAQLTKERA